MGKNIFLGNSFYHGFRRTKNMFDVAREYYLLQITFDLFQTREKRGEIQCLQVSASNNDIVFQFAEICV